MHYSVPALTASLAGGKVPTSCDMADDDVFRRGEIAVSYEQRRETPLHWTRVEAGFLAGACPDELATFFASITRLGQQQVVSQVTAELTGLGVVS